MGCFAAAFTVACLGVGLTAIWWLTTLAIAIVVFVSVERGQFRTSRPKVAKLHRVIAGGS